MAYFLGEQGHLIFPHPFLADEDGLLAVTDTLDADMVLTGYHFGIFPWYNEGSQVLWWYTHPRFVLFPDRLKISKSMRNVINRGLFTITENQDFESVIRSCSVVPRKGQDGTWIHDDMIAAYVDLHHRGYAHSVEVYQDDQLVGGLYGIKLGKIFFGESMFAKVSNASKVALIFLTQQLRKEGFYLIDCQQETNHLKSLGAELLPGDDFYRYIRNNLKEII